MQIFIASLFMTTKHLQQPKCLSTERKIEKWIIVYPYNEILQNTLKNELLINTNGWISEMLLLLLLSCFSHVRLCATPEMAAHQAPLSLGFSRQEHWSGLPFSSPMHESEKWKGSRSVMFNPQWSHGLQPSRLLHPWDFPGKSTGVGCHCLLHQKCYIKQKKLRMKDYILY